MYRPTLDVVSTLLCRTPSSKDKFVVSVLRFWCNDVVEGLADVLANSLVR